MPQSSENENPQILRHKTAIKRYSLSRPMRLVRGENLITPDTEVLDYGCGHGQDVQQLKDAGVPARGWDPVYAPDGDRSPADVVNLGYVVNVIEDEHERAEVLQAAWSRSKKLLIVSARLKQDMQSPAWLQFGDGCVTRSGTFQKYFEQSELREWIDATLGVPSTAAAPGVFLVFKDELVRTAYVASRFRRQTRPPGMVDRFRGARETLAPLMDFVVEHGRLPEGSEALTFAGVGQEFGSLKRAFQRIRTATGKDYWDSVRQERSQDLLVYLALARFGGRPRFHELPEETQHDVRAFFGTYTKACGEADHLLYRAGKREEIEIACRHAPTGKKTPSALYVHATALPQLSPELRVYEGCAKVLTGMLEGANVVKLHRDKAAVSYLWYPAFDDEGHPALAGSFIVFLSTQQARYRDYTAVDNPPVLHRKEEFVRPDYQGRDDFAALTAEEERAGLFEDVAQIGTRSGWEAVLATKGVAVQGHRLVPFRR